MTDMQDLTRDLLDICRLQQGWDSHGGRPLQAEALRNAIRFMSYIENRMYQSIVPQPQIVLNSDGTIDFEWGDGGGFSVVPKDDVIEYHYDDTTHKLGWDVFDSFTGLSPLVYKIIQFIEKEQRVT